jgi:anti-sigma28 factor (negative regulator of flagellin synthesis)
MQTQNKPRPEFDIIRVDAIRNQLDENNYHVDPGQIADKIIDLEVALCVRN